VPVTQPTVVVLALSRGRGVPQDARGALAAIEDVANVARGKGDIVSVTREVIGLEGETRLCIVFRDESALVAVRKEIRDLASGVDLLTVSEENCAVK
jgi:hypothetical protein